MHTWELQHHRRFFSFTDGAGCMAAVFEQALEVEVAGGEKRLFGGLFWDLSHLNEHISRADLAERARILGIPPLIVNCALAAYQRRRLLTLHQAGKEVGYGT